MCAAPIPLEETKATLLACATHDLQEDAATALFITYQGVKKRVKRLFEMFQVNTIIECIAAAYRQGLLPSTEVVANTTLTDKQVQLLDYIAQGMDYRTIADKFRKSPGWVKQQFHELTQVFIIQGRPARKHHNVVYAALCLGIIN